MSRPVFPRSHGTSAARPETLRLDQPGLNRLSPHEWVIEHFGGIMGAGIGAYTAFFVFGGRTLLGSLLDGNWILVPWLAPTVIGITAISWLTRRHRARFDPGERTDPAPRELARLPQGRS